MVLFWLCVCLSGLSSVLWLSSSTRRFGLPLLLPVLTAVSLAALAVEPADVYAASSTPSNALDPDQEEYYNDWSDFFDECGSDMDVMDDLLYKLALLLSGDLSFLGPVVSTPSSAAYEDPALPEAVEGVVYPCDPVPYALPADSSVVNVLRYSVRINGSAYDLYLSPEYVDQIYIDGSSQIWNVGTTSISGRLFPGDFTATATTGYLVTLGPCLGNNFSANRNYGSPNYMRRYYWSGNSLTYDTTYVRIYLEGDPPYPFRVSDTLKYVLIFLMGGALICLWKKSWR